MSAPKDDVQKQLARLAKEVPKRGMERYPSVLKSVSELPNELQPPSITAPAVLQSIHTIINFPPQIQRGWYYVPKQALLFTPTGLIHIMASIWPGEEPQVIPINRSSILYVKVTLWLLYGFLEILAEGAGAPIHIRVEFNTVAWGILSRPLNNLLQSDMAEAVLPDGQPTYSVAAQQVLDTLPLKFKNGVKIYALLPGEALEELVFQPSIWNVKKIWPFQFRKRLTADTSLALTNNFVVALQEELGVRYGWILTYIPRNKIIAMQNQSSSERYNELVIQFAPSRGAEGYKIPIAKDALGTWRNQWIRHGGPWQDVPNGMQKPPGQGKLI